MKSERAKQRQILPRLLSRKNLLVANNRTADTTSAKTSPIAEGVLALVERMKAAAMRRTRPRPVAPLVPISTVAVSAAPADPVEGDDPEVAASVESTPRRIKGKTAPVAPPAGKKS